MVSQLLYVSPNDSIRLYINNTDIDFVVQFDKPLQINDHAQIELLEFVCELEQKKIPTRGLCILSDMCDQQNIVFGKQAPVLRFVCLDSNLRKLVHMEFQNSYKVPCTKGLWNQCRFYIRDEKLAQPSFPLTNVQLTLRITNEFQSVL